MPCERTVDGVRDVCDRTVHAHADPVVSRGYRHRLHMIAEAFVAVGHGVRYTRAAQRTARGREWHEPTVLHSPAAQPADRDDASARRILRVALTDPYGPRAGTTSARLLTSASLAIPPLHD